MLSRLVSILLGVATLAVSASVHASIVTYSGTVVGTPPPGGPEVGDPVVGFIEVAPDLEPGMTNVGLDLIAWSLVIDGTPVAGNGTFQGGSTNAGGPVLTLDANGDLIGGGGAFSTGSPSSIATFSFPGINLGGGAISGNAGVNGISTTGQYGFSTAAQTAGDYDDSGQVEQGDLDLVLQNWGAGFAGLPAAWINQRPTTGIVDQAELDGVLLNWGDTTAPRASAAAVPEPSAFVGLGLVGLARCRRCRRVRLPA